MIFLSLLLVTSSATADFTPILSKSRNELVAHNGSRLNKTIQQLLEGDHVTLRNIGAILKQGQELAQQNLAHSSSFGQERVILYKAKDTKVAPPHSQPLVEHDPIQVSFTEAWATYSQPQPPATASSSGTDEYTPTYVDFANTVLGGGWDAGGNVQEEQMIQQCPDFPLILSEPLNENHDHGFYTRKYSGHVPSDDFEAHLALRGPGKDSADPILLTHLRCLQEIKDE